MSCHLSEPGRWCIFHFRNWLVPWAYAEPYNGGESFLTKTYPLYVFVCVCVYHNQHKLQLLLSTARTDPSRAGCGWLQPAAGLNKILITVGQIFILRRVDGPPHAFFVRRHAVTFVIIQSTHIHVHRYVIIMACKLQQKSLIHR